MPAGSDYFRYGRDYFDNPALAVGYGRYAYDGRYAPVAARMMAHYDLKPGMSVLEIGAAKGFMLVEFQKLGMKVAGIDASEYAVANAHPDLAGKVQLGDAASLAFGDRAFDFVYGKEVLPHIPERNIRKALTECIRVSQGKLFFEIQCGRSPGELAAMKKWDATHEIVQTPEWWNALLSEVRYPGDVHYKVLIPDHLSETA